MENGGLSTGDSTTLSYKPRILAWSTESRLFSVFPAHAGIQAGFELEPKTNLDAGFHRHDELSLCLQHALSSVEGARDFKHLRKGTLSIDMFNPRFAIFDPRSSILNSLRHP